MSSFLKGHKFEGTDGMGYELMHDVIPGTVCTSVQFKPYGGAPKPEAGKEMPDWLAKAIKKELP